MRCGHPPQSPIKAVGCFSAFWEDIFNKRHALVPDIQNSHAWQRRLVLAQQHVIEVSGKQGGGITCALRHLSFAKQRFDSATGPARKFCCLLSAIVVLLVIVATDSRLAADQRGRAQAMLDHMTPKRIAAAGLFADDTSECARLFRRFEKNESRHSKVVQREEILAGPLGSPVSGWVCSGRHA